MSIQEEDIQQEKAVPLLCEQEKRPNAIPRNLGPCIGNECPNPSKYICPKCSSNYCSVVCYKSHSTDCVEAFYQENIKEELKGRRSDEQTQKKMRNLLKEYNEQLDEDSKQFEIPQKVQDRLEELEQLMDDNELDIDCLTIDEQQDFERFIMNTPELQKYILPWTPWWEIQEGLFSLLVSEMNSSSDSQEKPPKLSKALAEVSQYRTHMQKRIPKTIIPFNRLSKTPPHKDLPYQLLNLITGWVMTLRVFNGEACENPLETLNMLVSITVSANSASRIELGTVDNAIIDVISSLNRIDPAYVNQFASQLQEDLSKILTNKVLVLEILYRLYDVLHEGQLELRDLIEEGEEEGESIVQKRKNLKSLGDIKQKMLFYLSYVKDGIDMTQFKQILESVQNFTFEKQRIINEDSELAKFKKLNLIL